MTQSVGPDQRSRESASADGSGSSRRMAMALFAVAVGSALVLVASPSGASPQLRGSLSPGSMAQAPVLAATVPGAIVPGTSCPLFPKRNYWRTPVNKLPRHKKSVRWIRSIGAGEQLHPDFGPSFGEQSIPYGIPVTIVNNSHPTVTVRFRYASESDHVPYPLGSDTVIEGGAESDGDRHTVIVNSDTCELYETWDTREVAGQWLSGSGATWNLRSNALRPKGWTSADAAGLPILPGLLTYDEVRAGRVKHAIRFTAPTTRDRFVWPARHEAGARSSAAYPPMGARFRLKGSFSTDGYSAEARVVLQGMRRYGIVLADNGSPWYFQGTSDERWPIELIDELKTIPGSAFEAVRTGPMKIRENSARAKRR